MVQKFKNRKRFYIPVELSYTSVLNAEVTPGTI